MVTCALLAPVPVATAQDGAATPLTSPPAVPVSAVGGEQLSGCETNAAPGFAIPPMITASGWIVADLDSGEVLAARDSHGRYRPASIIKTLLASVVLDELNLDTIVTVTAEDLAEAEGSMVGVGPGGKYSVDRLLHGLLMASGNDVALIFRDAMSRADFSRIVGTELWGFPGYPAGSGAGAPDPAAPPTAQPQPTTAGDGTVVNPGFLLSNDNQLLYNYPGALGGKTGFTDDARHTFIGAAKRDGRQLTVVLLDDTREPKAPWEQAAVLLDAGFATPTDRSVGTLVPPKVHPRAGQVARGKPLAGGAARSSTTAASGPLSRYGPWIALVVAIVIVLAGGLRLRRSGARR